MRVSCYFRCKWFVFVSIIFLVSVTLLTFQWCKFSTSSSDWIPWNICPTSKLLVSLSLFKFWRRKGTPGLSARSRPEFTGEKKMQTYIYLMPGFLYERLDLICFFVYCCCFYKILLLTLFCFSISVWSVVITFLPLFTSAASAPKAFFFYSWCSMVVLPFQALNKGKGVCRSVCWKVEIRQTELGSFIQISERFS